MQRIVFGLGSSVLLVVMSSPAGAQEEGPAPPAPAGAPAPAPAPAPPSPFEIAPGAPVVGPGVALGYENGLWGSSFTQSLRLRVPFGPQWGLVVKAVITHPTDHSHNVQPHYGGGRLEVWGASRPIGGFARVYGGGGPVVTTKVLGTGGDKDVHVGIGGYFGLEIFMTRKVSFTAEIGGSSNPDGTAASATVLGGLQWYLGQ